MFVVIVGCNDAEILQNAWNYETAPATILEKFQQGDHIACRTLLLLRMDICNSFTLPQNDALN